MARLLQQAANLTPGDVEEATSLLIESGKLESALLDSGIHEDYTIHALDQFTCFAARALLTEETPTLEVLNQIARLAMPYTVDISPIEGFAYYCLFPRCYAEAVKMFVAEADPAEVLVVGIRTAGGPLSAVVAEQLRTYRVPTFRTTVRPYGHPFDRQVRLDDRQRAAISQSRGWVAVVDEGPGISGSSFSATVRAVMAEGVDLARIVIFPSWNADITSLRSPDARSLWASLRSYVVPFQPQRDAPALGEIEAEWSAGNWRHTLLDQEDWPACHPQHERRKYLCRRNGRMFVAHFAGIGTYGRQAQKVAEQLSECWIHHAPELHDGFLISPFLEGRRLTRMDCTEDFLRHAAAYIAQRAKLSVQPCSATSFDELEEMIVTNCTEAGLLPPRLAQFRRQFEQQEPVAIDGRMQSYEWIRTHKGFRKLDAIDHHRDHFFPGCADPGWDLAGLITEFQLDATASATVCSHYITESRDFTILGRFPLYRIGYLAFRLGYCEMASQSLDGEEARRFSALSDRYRSALQRATEEAA